jgi:hypothetical protein
MYYWRALPLRMHAVCKCIQLAVQPCNRTFKAKQVQQEQNTRSQHAYAWQQVLQRFCGISKSTK